MREARAFASDLCFVLALPLMVFAWAVALSLGPALLYPSWAMAAAGVLLMPTPMRAALGLGIAALAFWLVGVVVLLAVLWWWWRGQPAAEPR